MALVGLKGTNAAAALARQRMTAVPRSFRSISTVRSQALRFSTQRTQSRPIISTNAPWRMTPAVLGLAAIRFNSTSSSPAEISPDPIIPEHVTNNTDIFDISQIPEGIGYLNSLGLNYGWGPTSMVQYTVEHIHVLAGIPWWASIVAFAVLTRLLLFKPAMDASDVSARLRNARPKLDPLKRDMKQFMNEGKAQEAQAVRAQLSEMHAEHGIKPWKSLISMVQLPIGFGIFRSVHKMADLPVPGLLNESVLWLNDLTIADPYCIMPALCAGLMYLSLKKGGDFGAMPILDSSSGQAMMKFLPGVSFAFMNYLPGAVQVYFLVSGVLGLCQAYLITWPTFRRWANLTIPEKRTADKIPESVRNIQSKTLRDTVIRIEKEKAARLQAQERLAKAQEPAENLSFIDRIMNQGKSFGKSISDEIADKLGTSSLDEREAKDRKKRAGDYENERKREDEALREERNEARRQEHLKILENEKTKAVESSAAARKRMQRGPRGD